MLIEAESVSVLADLCRQRSSRPEGMLAVQRLLESDKAPLTLRERALLGAVLSTLAIEIWHGVRDGEMQHVLRVAPAA